MLLEPLRRERDRLYDELANYPNENYRVATRMLDQCCRGEFEDFKENFMDFDEDDGHGWCRVEHQQFYNACESVRFAEQNEYNALALLP